MPAAALPDAEELLDSLAVQVARVRAAEHAQNFWKSLKPCGLRRYSRPLHIAARKRAIRHYMISRIFLGRLLMNDKGGDFNGSMQHFT